MLWKKEKPFQRDCTQHTVFIYLCHKHDVEATLLFPEGTIISHQCHNNVMTYFSEYAHLYELQATGHRTLHAYQRRSDCQSWRVFSSVCTLEVAYLKLLLTERWNNVSSRGSIKGFQFDYYPNCHLNQTKYLSFSLTLDGAHLMLWCNMCERVVPTVYCSFNAAYNSKEWQMKHTEPWIILSP